MSKLHEVFAEYLVRVGDLPGNSEYWKQRFAEAYTYNEDEDEDSEYPDVESKDGDE